MKKMVLTLLIIVAICFVIDTNHPSEVVGVIGGTALCGLTLMFLLGIALFAMERSDTAKINAQYHDRLPPAPDHDTTTIRPREGAPIPNYIPKWQRPGYDPDK